MDKSEIIKILEGYYSSIMDLYMKVEQEQGKCAKSHELFGMLTGYKSALILLKA